MSLALRPYLNFPGTTREALEFYQGIFGGELTITTFGEFQALPENSPSNDKVMHSDLVTEHFSLHAADSIEETPIELVIGNNVNLAVMGEGAQTLETVRAAFAKLAEGGTVEMPLEKQMWGDHYGSLVDRFGISWMFDVGVEEEGGASDASA